MRARISAAFSAAFSAAKMFAATRAKAGSGTVGSSRVSSAADRICMVIGRDDCAMVIETSVFERPHIEFPLMPTMTPKGV